MKLQFILALVFLSGPVLADEVSDFCNMTTAAAESKSSILRSPTVFTGEGEPQTSGKILATGLRYSLSGLRQAGLTDRIADAQCQMYGADKKLMDTAQNFQNKVQLDQLNAEIPLLENALAQAENNIVQEKKLFDSQNGIIGDLITATQARDTILSNVTQAKQQLAVVKELPIVYNSNDLNDVTNESISAQSKVATLMGDINVANGWDVVVQGGIQHHLDATSTNTGFIAINVEWNFGSVKSRREVSKAGDLTAKYLNSQHDSAQNTYGRLVRSLDDILQVEINNRRNLVQEHQSIQGLIDLTKGVDSVQAQRATRTLTVQLLVIDAQLKASSIKLADLSKFQQRN